MPLDAGARLGPYEIQSALGAGGMGEVYRATDTNLGRQVAIKVLPEAFAEDPDRLARFEREAKTLAALNHPNIATIHGVEKSQGVYALVMELVEGEDLSQRISRGPMPIDEVLPIARQVAEALEAAHEHGIIHRDLKPANVKVRSDGMVKVLDFGLAKLAESSGATTSNASLSPTITSPALMTGVGVLLGTAAYMSPEQAKGRPADKRSDVWSFGCVLYEMLTGKRAFDGEDVTDTLAAVLRGEPDWNALPPDLPVALRVVLQRCLNKERRRRITDISTIRFVVDEPMLSTVAGGVLSGPAASRRPVWRQVAPIVSAAIIASIATGVTVWTLRGGSSTSRAMTRFPVPLEDGQSFGSNGLSLVAISPDGSRIAYAALSPGDASARNTQRLYVRSMSEDVARPIVSEVQGIIGEPVFSPDGQSIAFYTGPSATGTGVYGGKLRTVSANGGTAVTLSDIEFPLGVSWTGDSIVLGQPSKGIVRVPASGGEPEQIVAVKNDEIAQGPQLLPGGRAVLFTVAHGTLGLAGPTDDAWDKANIVVQSLVSGERKTLIQGGSDARYLPSGHIVYASAGTLRAVAFDAGGLRLTGKPAPVLEGIRRSRLGPVSRTGSAHFGVSETGSLVYLPGPASVSSSLQTLAFFDRRTDAVEPLKVAPAMYEYPRISPDGHQVAVGINNGKQADVWLYDLSGSTAMRQLTSGGKNRFPIWSADGQHVAFQSDREGDLAIFWQRADGTAPAARLTKPGPNSAHIPDSWSPKNDELLFDVQTESAFALWMLSVRDGKVAPFGGVQSGSIPPAAEFSPDGRWVAYQSGELPARRLFVQPLPTTGVPLPVATGGYPHWSPDGKQLFYQLGGRLLVVTVNVDRNFTVSNPSPTLTQLPEGGMRFDAQSALGPGGFARNYDLAADGDRVLGTSDETPLATAAARHIEVVLNWQEELKRLVPTTR